MGLVLPGSALKILLSLSSFFIVSICMLVVEIVRDGLMLFIYF